MSRVSEDGKDLLKAATVLGTLALSIAKHSSPVRLELVYNREVIVSILMEVLVTFL